MIFPEKVPGLRWLMILTAVYGVIWMALEGDLRRVTLMGVSASIVLTGYLIQRVLGGRPLKFIGWLIGLGLSGLLAGLGSTVLTLFLMALKTGLHGHGPEFIPSEIEQVAGMLPVWGAVGLVAGLGLAVLVWGFKKAESSTP